MKKWLVLFMLAGCDVVDIALVTVGDGGTFTPMRGAPCANSGECAGGQLCEKRSCSDGLGRCQQRPAFCDGESRPTCGCDGVTYWNECLRRKAGQEAGARGQCFEGRTCDLSAPCPEGASCARLVFPGECGRVPAGACFVMPAVCEGVAREHFFECNTGMAQCLDACAAIRSGKVMERSMGPCP